ncbi:MAG: cbb3-type cytochrome oxidase assembly protein CcoS [Rhodanobacteraceae bacterium]|jgi:cbb3-type cytochrome oxidase maturation protein|nr:cbb3-type cytochrome oxidase assembly protein CcoS [Rhodanobacteraceae bacterium]
MNIILLLIPLSVILLSLAAAAFFWAVDNDQFEDMDTPSLMPLAGDASGPSARSSRDDSVP